ncbi:hypothetical protein KM043_008876 [Ampulex compressa]|nr:hypothetical protein KM043_008876 [Ampulex compressa]
MTSYKLLFLILCELCLVRSQISLPMYLRECYANKTALITRLPMNLQVLVDIVRKVERSSHTTMDLRTISSSLLHRFKFDGIQFQEHVSAKEGVLPYTATGTQRTKNILIEELVPGNSEIFPQQALTLAERCTLHEALSNTIIKYSPQTGSMPCPRIDHTEKITDRGVLKNIRYCPRECGVILTEYSTIALGPIVAGIAASIQRQNVTVNQLLFANNTPSVENTKSQSCEYDEEEVEFVIPKDQMLQERSMWYSSLSNTSSKVDNVWFSTVAGELAEMVVYQGPYVGSDMILGATGFWNSTIWPSIYYVIGQYENFDLTRAELIGAIDGLILAESIRDWQRDMYSLRLSQILNMYYSNKGISFDPRIRVCDRSRAFPHIVPRTILVEQTYIAAQVLASRNTVAYISPDTLEKMVGYAVDIFFDYISTRLLSSSSCQDHAIRPRVEVILAFDGSWSTEYTINFISILIEDMNVSMYGSKLGIIHGTTGAWLLNVTNSPATSFFALANIGDTAWPTTFNCTRTLETVYRYLNATWAENEKLGIIGNLGQTVLLLVPLVYISNSEKTSILTLLQEIKQRHPDVHFVYYTSEYNAYLFKPFLISNEDHLITTSKIDDILEYLLTVPHTLRLEIPLKPILFGKPKPQMEDYVRPSEFLTYRLHAQFKKQTKKIIITIHNFGYGKIKVCSWYQFNQSNTKERISCEELGEHKELSIMDHFKCAGDNSCPHTYYQIQNVTSLQKCAELDCETPDQVRFAIRTHSADENIFQP